MLTETTIFRGAFWGVIGAVFDRFVSFLLVIFIAPLGPANLGIFHLSLRVFNSIVKLLKVRRTSKLREYIQDPKGLKFEETAAFFLKAHFIGGSVVALFFLVLILAFSPFKSLAFLALALPFAFVNTYMLLLLQLLQRFKKVFIIQAVFVFVFQALYLLIFIKILNFGIGAAFAGQLLMAIFVSIISFVFVFDRINLLGFFQKINFRMFIRKKIAFANAIFNTIFPILDILLITLLFGISATGQYIVLLSLPLLMNRIPTTLFGMFVHVARAKTKKNEDIAQVSKSVFKWILMFTIPLFVVILLFPSEILSSIFHKSYVKELIITRILAISYLLLTLSWMTERILVAKNKKVQRVISNYIFAFLFICLSLIFASLGFEILGIALAFLISSLFDSILKLILVVKITKVFFIGLDHIKILCVGTISALLSYMLIPNSPLPFLFFFFTMYISMLWVAGVPSQKTLIDLRKMIVKEFTLGESDE